MADLLSTVYFDFETTTDNSILHDPKMSVIKYCQIYAFHPDLKLGKLVIFSSVQQNDEEIYSIDNFYRNILNNLMQFCLTK